jgi:hypothetical protein
VHSVGQLYSMHGTNIKLRRVCFDRICLPSTGIILIRNDHIEIRGKYCGTLKCVELANRKLRACVIIFIIISVFFCLFVCESCCPGVVLLSL